MDTSQPGTADLAGERIRRARMAQGMTQAALAAAVGVSRSAVAQWETERAGQIRGNLTRIAAALGVSAGYLLTGEEAQARPETPDALALLRLYHTLSPDDRQLLLRTAVRLSRAARPKPDDQHPDDRAPGDQVA